MLKIGGRIGELLASDEARSIIPSSSTVPEEDLHLMIQAYKDADYLIEKLDRKEFDAD